MGAEPRRIAEASSSPRSWRHRWTPLWMAWVLSKSSCSLSLPIDAPDNTQGGVRGEVTQGAPALREPLPNTVRPQLILP